MAFQSHELSLQNLNAIGQSLLQISKFRSSTVYSNQNKPITLKNDDIMTKYFFAISRIRNLVGLRGILSLINADGWNAAVDPCKLQVSHRSGNQTSRIVQSSAWVTGTGAAGTRLVD